MSRKNVVITGASGILGSSLYKLLNNDTRYVVTKFVGDVTSSDDVKNFFSSNKCDVLIHLAAKVPVRGVDENPQAALAVNVLGTALVAQSVAQANPKAHFIHISSSHVYKPSEMALKEEDDLEPSTFYGVTKLLSERTAVEICKFNLQPISVLRVFSMWDEKQSKDFLYGNLKARLNNYLTGEDFELYGSNSIRNFSHSTEIAKKIKIVIDERLVGVFNIGNDRNMSVGEFARTTFRRDIKIVDVGESNVITPNLNKFKKRTSANEA